jgi:uronate dehydrogenase
MKNIVLTGAAGNLGPILASKLAVRGHRLLLSDIVDFPQALPQNASFRKIDLNDRDAMLALVAETEAVLHFGAISTEKSFEEILGPNIRGTYHAFELARLAGARIVFASSNHTIGFHERGRILPEDCDPRPDTFYGLSKAYGELLARLYWDKHGVESLSIRIGTCLPKPKEARHLSIWLSHDDLVRMIEAGLRTPVLGCRVIWGVSQNRRSWWKTHDQDLGELRKDDAELFADTISENETGNPIARRYQGGAFCVQDYSRNAPSPQDIFGWMHKDGPED